MGPSDEVTLKRPSSAGSPVDEKEHAKPEILIDPGFEINDDGIGTHLKDSPQGKIYIPDDNDEFIDPRLKDYPIPLVAKTVDLSNDDTYVPVRSV